MASVSKLSERPLVAIVGRPNVGKSSFFNRILGERRAIVEPTAGVTRDRLVLPAEVSDPDLAFDLMDTGGIGIVDRADLSESVEMQVMVGVHAAEVLLFLVDAREGLTPLDKEVARMMRKTDTPILLCANKCEGTEALANLDEFRQLGLGEIWPMSAMEGKGIAAIYDEMATHLPTGSDVECISDSLRIAVIGRRNTGKSSFVNALIQEERLLVSDIAGTTRDAIDIQIDWDGTPVTLVDTAGVHRRGKVANSIEYFSLTRSDHAIRRSDVTLLFLDLTQPPAKLDQELARTVMDRHKPTVIVGTKIDLVPELSVHEFRSLMEHKFPHLRGAPICMISNTERIGLARVLRQALRLREEASTRVGTGAINRALEQAFQKLRFRGRSEKPRVYYGTQLRVAPPSFLLFVNKKALFDKENVRSISRELRSRLGYEHVPIRVVLRERKRSASKRATDTRGKNRFRRR